MTSNWLILIILFKCMNLTVNNTFSDILFTKSLKLDQFLGRCPGQKNLPVYFEDIHYMQFKNNISLSMKVVATRNILPQLKLVLKLERCKAREDLDSCEPYQDVNRTNLCELQRSKNQAWTPFFRQTDSELPCPLQKGTYSSRNATLDTLPLMALPIQGCYWKVRALVYEVVPSKLIMCIYLAGYVE